MKDTYNVTGDISIKDLAKIQMYRAVAEEYNSLAKEIDKKSTFFGNFYFLSEVKDNDQFDRLGEELAEMQAFVDRTTTLIREYNHFLYVMEKNGES